MNKQQLRREMREREKKRTERINDTLAGRQKPEHHLTSQELAQRAEQQQEAQRRKYFPTH